MDVDDDIHTVDTAYRDYLSWKATLFFDLSYDPQGPFHKIEMIDWLSNPTMKNCRLYFSSIRYLAKSTDTPFVSDTENDGFGALKRDLQLAAIDGGYNIVCNGSRGNAGKNDIPHRRFVCQHNRVYDFCRKKLQGKPQYRVERLHNNKKNSRGKNGLSMARKTSTKRAASKTECCSFRIIVFFDVVSGCFFVKGSGSERTFYHEHHQKLQPHQLTVRTSLLNPEQKQLLQDIHDVRAKHSVARNLHLHRTGICLSRQQIANLVKKGEKERSDVRDGASHVDNMIDYFKREHVSYCALFDDQKQTDQPKTPPRHSDRSRKSTTIASESNFYRSNLPSLITEIFSGQNQLSVEKENRLSQETVQTETFAPVDCTANEYCKSHRIALKATDDQQLFLACGWSLPKEIRRFKLAPSVVSVDATEDTNNENRSLLTFSARDANGNQFVFLRVYLPNQQAWVFRWVFQVAFVKLVGAATLRRIIMFITDGDSQETSQLDLAIAELIPQAKRARCGWHIVDRGWIKNGPRPERSEGKTAQHRDLKKFLQEWMYSWMAGDRSGICENEEEYEVSKSLFLTFLRSNDCVSVWGQKCAETMITFFRRFIEPHEDYFVLYRRFNLRHFDAYSNTAHEGTNAGMKHSVDAVGPQNSLSTSTITLCSQGSRSCIEFERRAGQSLTNNPLWCELPCAGHVTSFALSLIQTEMDQAVNYSCMRTSEREFRVVRSERSACKTRIPVFQRVRTVAINQFGRFACSCCLFQRRGYGCRHIACVLTTIDPSWPGYGRDDTDLFWWSLYQQYGHMNDALQEPLKRIEEKGISGPKLPRWDELSSSVPIINLIPKEFQHKPIHERVVNYSNREVQAAIAACSGTKMAAGLRQEIFVQNDCAADGTDRSDDQQILDETANFDESDDQSPTHNVYEVLNPFFLELVKAAQGNATAEQIQSVKDFMMDKATQFKREYCEGKAFPGGKRVSSGLPMNKRRKTHGTKHFR